MGAPDSPVRHRTLSGVPPRHPTVRVLEQLTVGGFVLLRHRIVWCHSEQVMFTVRCASDSVVALFIYQPLFQSTVARSSRCSAGALDSPVAHQTVRRIIAECAWKNPRVAGSRCTVLVHWTLSGGTPDCPVRHSSAHSGFFALLYLIPNLNIYWFVLNLYAPVEHIF
jgi:hypothetical protein